MRMNKREKKYSRRFISAKFFSFFSFFFFLSDWNFCSDEIINERLPWNQGKLRNIIATTLRGYRKCCKFGVKLPVSFQFVEYSSLKKQPVLNIHSTNSRCTVLPTFNNENLCFTRAGGFFYIRLVEKIHWPARSCFFFFFQWIFEISSDRDIFKTTRDVWVIVFDINYNHSKERRILTKYRKKKEKNNIRLRIIEIIKGNCYFYTFFHFIIRIVRF